MSTSSFEERLRHLVAILDDPALESLASRGLLRRARGDTARGVGVHIERVSDAALEMVVGEYAVRMPEAGPAAATCSCPASGVCQHILLAVLYLQSGAATSMAPAAPTAAVTPAALATPPVPADVDDGERQIIAIASDQLEQWAGKLAASLGAKLAARHEAEILRDPMIRVKFPSLNAEVRFVPGAGLDGCIVNAGKSDVTQLVAAAVIAFQHRARGVAVPEVAPDVLEASSGTPRTRDEVLASCQSLLEQTLANGLAMLSSDNQQRWATLAVSALGVNLPRLALAIRAVGAEVALANARDASSDLARILERMCEAHALSSALQTPGGASRPELVGTHRTRYDDVGHLELVGAAAWPWSTASGFEGLTVLFWEPFARRWNSWSASRPRHQSRGFKVATEFALVSPWEGAMSARQLAESAFRLLDARRNAANRLSATSRSRVLITGDAKLCARGIDPVTRWTKLPAKASGTGARGLTEDHPLDAIVAIKPSAWRDRSFDVVTQTFTWNVLDEEGAALPLELRFDRHSEAAIRSLETVPAERLTQSIVIGRVVKSGRQIAVQPFSLHLSSSEVIHPYFQRHAAAVPPDSPSAAPDLPEAPGDAEFDSDEELPALAPLTSSLTQLLDEADDAVLALAESGVSAPHARYLDRLSHLAARARRRGLQTLATSLASTVAAPSAQSVLRCRYVSRVHRSAVIDTAS